jgi:hypothetical protein
MAAVEVKRILNLIPELLKPPYSRIWTAYDKEADVLYINFKKPSHADDSELTDDDIITCLRHSARFCSAIAPQTLFRYTRDDVVRISLRLCEN